ncbi:MAG: hypothetical protein K6F76_07750 [Clostridiales bacterium]|nr:hypothetical protein [Clostridiales bacterium]
MKKIIIIIFVVCVISALILLCYSYNYNNRINDISEACGIDFSDVMKNENISHFKKDGLYVYAEVIVNDSEIHGLIEKLTASGYFCCELKKLPNKSFLDWWNVKDRKNVLTYAMASSTTGDYGTTVPTVTEIDICDIDGENTIVYIGYYKWSLA